MRIHLPGKSIVILASAYECLWPFFFHALRMVTAQLQLLEVSTFRRPEEERMAEFPLASTTA